MFSFLVKAALVIGLVLLGLFVYQKFLDPSVSSADLISGARQLGGEVVEFGSQVADSILASRSSTSSGPEDNSVAVDSFSLDGDPPPDWPIPGSTVDTLDEILDKYRAFNLLLEDRQ